MILMILRKSEISQILKNAGIYRKNPTLIPALDFLFSNILDELTERVMKAYPNTEIGPEHYVRILGLLNNKLVIMPDMFGEIPERKIKKKNRDLVDNDLDALVDEGVNALEGWNEGD